MLKAYGLTTFSLKSNACSENNKELALKVIGMVENVYFYF